jgi:hypothetical protein
VEIPVIHTRPPWVKQFSASSSVASSVGDARFVGNDQMRGKHDEMTNVPDTSFVKTTMVDIPGKQNTVVEFSLPPWMEARHIAPTLFSETLTATKDVKATRLPRVRAHTESNSTRHTKHTRGKLASRRRTIVQGQLYIPKSGAEEMEVDLGDVISFITNEELPDPTQHKVKDDIQENDNASPSTGGPLKRTKSKLRRTSTHRQSISSEILASRTAERRLEEKLKRSLGFDGVKALQADEFVVPIKVALSQTLKLAVDVQNSDLRKSWHCIRDAFNRSGGILSPKAIRTVLIREVHLTLAQAQRIQSFAREKLMKPGDK